VEADSEGVAIGVEGGVGGVESFELRVSEEEAEGVDFSSSFVVEVAADLFLFFFFFLVAADELLVVSLVTVALLVLVVSLLLLLLLGGVVGLSEDDELVVFVAGVVVLRASVFLPCGLFFCCFFCFSNCFSNLSQSSKSTLTSSGSAFFFYLSERCSVFPFVVPCDSSPGLPSPDFFFFSSTCSGSKVISNPESLLPPPVLLLDRLISFFVGFLRREKHLISDLH